MVFLKEFFKKVDFEKKQQITKKAWNFSQEVAQIQPFSLITVEESTVQQGM